LKVDAGLYDRKDTPVAVELPAKDLPNSVWEALAEGPRALLFREIGASERVVEPVVVQAERETSAPEANVRLTWILRGETSAHDVRTFRFEQIQHGPDASTWSLSVLPEGVLDVKNRERTVLPLQHRALFAPELRPSTDP